MITTSFHHQYGSDSDTTSMVDYIQQQASRPAVLTVHRYFFKLAEGLNSRGRTWDLSCAQNRLRGITPSRRISEYHTQTYYILLTVIEVVVVEVVVVVVAVAAAAAAKKAHTSTLNVKNTF